MEENFKRDHTIVQEAGKAENGDVSIAKQTNSSMFQGCIASSYPKRDLAERQRAIPEISDVISKTKGIPSPLETRLFASCRSACVGVEKVRDLQRGPERAGHCSKQLEPTANGRRLHPRLGRRRKKKETDAEDGAQTGQSGEGGHKKETQSSSQRASDRPPSKSVASSTIDRPRNGFLSFIDRREERLAFAELDVFHGAEGGFRLG